MSRVEMWISEDFWTPVTGWMPNEEANNRRDYAREAYPHNGFRTHSRMV